MSIYSQIVSKTLAVGEQKSKGFCQSRQLRKHINRKVVTDTRTRASGILNVPHYWAIYYHEGRRVIQPVSAKFLVWFKNPKDDPRLNNGLSPIFRSDVRRLNLPLAELKRLRDAGKLVITKRSPRSGQPSFKGNPFFSDKPGGGLSGLDGDLVRIARKEAYAEVEKFLKSSGLKNKTIVRNI